MPFLVSIYDDSKPGLEVMNVGLWSYDSLALFRSPRIHKTFNWDNDRGLTTVILGEAGVEAVVRPTVVPGLFVLPCGPIPPNPAVSTRRPCRLPPKC